MSKRCGYCNLTEAAARSDRRVIVCLCGNELGEPADQPKPAEPAAEVKAPDALWLFLSDVGWAESATAEGAFRYVRASTPAPEGDSVDRKFAAVQAEYRVPEGKPQEGASSPCRPRDDASAVGGAPSCDSPKRLTPERLAEDFKTVAECDCLR